MLLGVPTMNLSEHLTVTRLQIAAWDSPTPNAVADLRSCALRRCKPVPRKGQALSKPPVYGGDFFADSVIADPLPAYRQMRNTGPMVWLPKNNI